jgi:hypothetical protein
MEPSGLYELAAAREQLRLATCHADLLAMSLAAIKSNLSPEAVRSGITAADRELAALREVHRAVRERLLAVLSVETQSMPANVESNVLSEVPNRPSSQLCAG